MIQLSEAELNHLRRLVAWVRCGIPQTPDDLMETVRSIAPAIGEPSDYAKTALVKMHRESAAVPQYIRAAIKALDKTMKREGGDIVDGENVSDRRLPEITK